MTFLPGLTYEVLVTIGVFLYLACHMGLKMGGQTPNCGNVIGRKCYAVLVRTYYITSGFGGMLCSSPQRTKKGVNLFNLQDINLYIVVLYRMLDLPSV